VRRCSKATVAPPQPRASSGARGQQRKREEPHRARGRDGAWRKMTGSCGQRSQARLKKGGAGGPK
jgi:hypothetical protein